MIKKIFIGSIFILNLNLNLLALDNNVKNNLLETKKESCDIKTIEKKDKTLDMKIMGDFKCIQFENVCIMLQDEEKKEIIKILKEKNIVK